jgi:hypothetical protein
MCSGCPETPHEVPPTGVMNRRGFLRFGGAGLASAVLLGTAGSRVLARTGPSLKAEFKAAATEYSVPQELLLAMGYVNTLWEMPPPGASDYVEGISTAAAPTASCSSCTIPGRTLWVEPRC